MIYIEEYLFLWFYILHIDSDQHTWKEVCLYINQNLEPFFTIGMDSHFISEEEGKRQDVFLKMVQKPIGVISSYKA